MSLFWTSVALSDGTCSKELVGNALGLTGTLILALLVVNEPVHVMDLRVNYWLFRRGKTNVLQHFSTTMYM